MQVAQRSADNCWGGTRGQLRELEWGLVDRGRVWHGCMQRRGYSGFIRYSDEYGGALQDYRYTFFAFFFVHDS